VARSGAARFRPHQPGDLRADAGAERTRHQSRREARRLGQASQLASITVPTPVIGARYDTMDPAYMEMMASRLPAGWYLYCPQGSHLAMYDDQQTYFTGLTAFLNDLKDQPAPQPGKQPTR